MCGIAGIFGPSFDKPFPLAALNHRGPDEMGVWKDHQAMIWLGHTRLSILDLSQKGHQPMPYMGGRYRIVFNGEIFNFVELKRELQGKGYVFQTDTDTEIIPAAYDLWGPECLRHFNGMYAFALWDNTREELWLARDRFGKKPLYYYRRGHEFAFASEVQALHRWLGHDAELDPGVVQSICAGRFEWHGTERTYLANVDTLPAGFCLWKSKAAFRMERWYRLEPNRANIPEGLAAQAETLRELLIDACRLRLRSDVPVATCLSGGLDSSSLTAVVHRSAMLPSERTAHDYHQVFCAAFPGTMLDESAKARVIANAVGAELKVHTIEPPSADRLLTAISSCDGPMHALAFYPIWELYGFIRENGIKVTLDGQGADEMMGGYFETIKSALRGALVDRSFGRLWEVYRTYAEHGESSYYSSRVEARAKLLQALRAPLSRAKHYALNLFRDDVLKHQLEYAQPLTPGLDPLQADLYSQFCQKQLPTILQQYDRCSMAHGVECRMPFMDHRIVEFVFSLPVESLIGGGLTKRVLREAVKGLVPESIRLNKTKVGFNAPVVEWFLGPLRELMLDTMLSTEFRQNAFFDGQRIESLFEKWLNKPEWGNAWAFWPPVHLVLWQRYITSSLSVPGRQEEATYG